MDTAAPTRPRPPRELTQRVRGPFSRWPRVADATLAVVLFLFSLLLTEGPGDTMVLRDLGGTPVPVLVVFAIAAAAVYWRRAYPVRVVAVAIASLLVLLGSGYADTGLSVIVALYSVGRYHDADLWGRAAAVAASIVIVLDGLTDDLPWGEVAFAVVVMLASWFVGRWRRMRAERAAQFLRQQEAEARRAVAEERTRIARELHDVVAHQVSLMTVQAGAAQAVVDDDPVAARRAMVAVEETGRQALDELRHLLGVLRPDTEETGRDPQPELADLPRLAGRVRAAGVDVVLEVEDVPADLPARVQLSAYRIVQEALTNVIRHAGNGARARVAVRCVAVDGRQVLDVEVEDDGGAGGPVPVADGGHGIVGMRERALLLGGDLQVGPTAAGGFRVMARLPLDANAPSPDGSRSRVEEVSRGQ
ncbi:sensor histidine kinase [Salsipaludibacter albus]|uniref:sensor histidine kinase n=1 Tax=Salsipaludibacter albus TaxID=2849650 RepID=UPI001EE49CB6